MTPPRIQVLQSEVVVFVFPGQNLKNELIFHLSIAFKKSISRVMWPCNSLVQMVAWLHMCKPANQEWSNKHFSTEKSAHDLRSSKRTSHFAHGWSGFRRRCPVGRSCQLKTRWYWSHVKYETKTQQKTKHSLFYFNSVVNKQQLTPGASRQSRADVAVLLNHQLLFHSSAT